MIIQYLLILTTSRENQLQEFGSLRRPCFRDLHVRVSRETRGDEWWARRAFMRRGSLHPIRFLVLYGQFRPAVLDLHNHLFLGA